MHTCEVAEMGNKNQRACVSGCYCKCNGSIVQLGL